MEVVTVVHIKLNRIGSASRVGGGLGGSFGKRIELLEEVADDEPGTVREIVIKSAEGNGEAPGSLDELKYTQGYGKASRQVFNIQGRNVQYSEPYAECEIYAALKSEGRYFRLEEIVVG